MTYDVRNVMLPVLLLFGLPVFGQTNNEDTVKPMMHNLVPPVQEITPTEQPVQQAPVVQTNGKKIRNVWKQFPRRYHILSFNYGEISPVSPGQNTQANINYTEVSTITGARAEKTFTGVAKNGFGNKMVNFALNYEYIWNSTNDWTLGMGGFHNEGGNGGIYFHFGYRYVLNLGWIDFKPGIDFYRFYGYGKVGNIDNSNKNLYFDGFTAASTWDVAHTNTYTDDDGNTYEDTYYTSYSADRTEVRYRRNASAFQPLLEATTHWRRLSVSAELGYMMQVKQKSTLVFKQWEGGRHEQNLVGTMDMRKNGAMSGPRVALMVGFLF